MGCREGWGRVGWGGVGVGVGTDMAPAASMGARLFLFNMARFDKAAQAGTITARSPAGLRMACIVEKTSLSSN